MFARDRQAGRLAGRWLPAGAAQLLWERIVRDDPELGPLVSPAGVARVAQQSWRRAREWCLSDREIAGDESAETAAFVRWSRRYGELLDEHDWVDAALAPSRVHAAAAAPGLEIVGFDRLTPLQEALLARWSEQGVEVRRAVRVGSDRNVRRVNCLDPAAEIDAAARWAAARLDGRDDLRLAIVVPDLTRRRDEVRRILERVLVPTAGIAGGPVPESQGFELAAARPLAEQPVVAAALDLLDAFVGSPDLAALGRLLRNPFLLDAGTESSARARLDGRIRRAESPGLGLPRLERLADAAGCPGLARALASGLAVVSGWPEKSLPSVCSKSILDLLAALGWPGTAPDSVEHQAGLRWRALVSEFGGCDEFTGRVSRAQAVGQLREMAGRVLFEPQELRAPLLVIDPGTSAGMRFDGLWVCGLDAGRWPPPAAPDPFLPRAVQLRHGMPRASATLAALEARAVLERLLASADEVVLSVAEVEDDAPVLPSPLLAGIAAGEPPARWPEPVLPWLLFAQRPPLDSLREPGMPALTAEEAGRGGARLLELQSACAFRAQVELRLGARALDEPAVGVGAAERGELLHAALARLWEAWGHQDVLLALDEAGVRAAVARAVATVLAGARASADGVLRHLLELEAGWLEARVLDLTDADRGRPPFAIESLERSCTARIGGLTLELRPDRVDRLADGSLAVIDYKTGANAEVKSWLGERPRLPQLPAYVQALGPARVGAVAFARMRSGDTRYVGLARDATLFPGLPVPGTRGGPRGVGGWEQLLGDWQRRLETLALEYVRGEASLAADPPRACEYCHLQALCRVGESGAAVAEEESADE